MAYSIETDVPIDELRFLTTDVELQYQGYHNLPLGISYLANFVREGNRYCLSHINIGATRLTPERDTGFIDGDVGRNVYLGRIVVDSSFATVKRRGRCRIFPSIPRVPLAKPGGLYCFTRGF